MNLDHMDLSILNMLLKYHFIRTTLNKNKPRSRQQVFLLYYNLNKNQTKFRMLKIDTGLLLLLSLCLLTVAIFLDSLNNQLIQIFHCSRFGHVLRITINKTKTSKMRGIVWQPNIENFYAFLWKLNSPIYSYLVLGLVLLQIDFPLFISYSRQFSNFSQFRTLWKLRIFWYCIEFP